MDGATRWCRWWSPHALCGLASSTQALPCSHAHMLCYMLGCIPQRAAAVRPHASQPGGVWPCGAGQHAHRLPAHAAVPASPAARSAWRRLPPRTPPTCAATHACHGLVHVVQMLADARMSRHVMSCGRAAVMSRAAAWRSSMHACQEVRCCSRVDQPALSSMRVCRDAGAPACKQSRSGSRTQDPREDACKGPAQHCSMHECTCCLPARGRRGLGLSCHHPLHQGVRSAGKTAPRPADVCACA